MTDKQITDTIATRVMGWKRAEAWAGWYDKKSDIAQHNTLWNPLINDADCMATWIEFAKTQAFVRIESGLNNIWHVGAFGSKEVMARDKDLLRAMCECMVKATEHGNGS